MWYESRLIYFENFFVGRKYVFGFIEIDNVFYKKIFGNFLFWFLRLVNYIKV